ncbi:MAG: laccase domain-containing protein, partial [Treponema sp.]|nr:laccase domain-containing protein [Treponema sp.]
MKDEFLALNFCRGGKVVPDSPVAGMTLLKTGSMRFRWNEENPNRSSFLEGLSLPDKKVAAVEHIHSHTVYAINEASQVQGLQGDGIITTNKKIIPVITAADCMPILIYDPVT